MSDSPEGTRSLLSDVETWPCGCAKGMTPHGAGWSDCIVSNEQKATWKLDAWLTAVSMRAANAITDYISLFPDPPSGRGGRAAGADLADGRARTRRPARALLRSFGHRDARVV
jgi:hypothetical protein